MRIAAIIAAITPGIASLAVPATNPPVAGFAHAGYGYDLPRGCRFVVRTVVVNGIEIPLRYVVCPTPPAANPTAPIG